MILPCGESCHKCGSSDIHRRFHYKGVDTISTGPSTGIPSSEWVNRDDRWVQPALQDCVVHHCRTCQFQWDGAPLQEADADD